MKFLILSVVAIATAQAAIAPSASYQLNESEQQKLVQELEDEELIKEVEKIIGTMDEAQLAKLENILSNYEEGSEFDLINEELKEMGMDEADIKDMVDLADMIAKFLRRVPDLEDKLELGAESLEDHVKLYLLGLPNKLGPLGFLGLHSILQDDEDIVDVKIEGFEPAPAAAAGSSVSPVGDAITRRLQAKQAAAPAAAPKAEKDIVGEILARRRRAIRMQ